MSTKAVLSPATARRPSAIIRYIGLSKYRFKRRLDRLLLAFRYFTGRLTEKDAHDLMTECEAITGWYPLLILTVNDALELAHETFEPCPMLRGFIDEGCSRVSRKWECLTDELYEVRRWAVELAEQYALSDGITPPRRRFQRNQILNAPQIKTKTRPLRRVFHYGGHNG